MHRDERRHAEILDEHTPRIQLLAQTPENERAPEHLTLARADRLIVQEFLTELTMTERRVFALLAEGLRPHLIAASLGIAFNEARNAARACERKREHFQLLYDTGRPCGYRAATIQALQEGRETSEELAERAFAHLEGCQRCCAEHQTNAKRLRRAFRDQASILLPPLFTSRLGWLTRLVRRVRHVRRSVNQHATVAQGSVHQRLATLFAGGGAKITAVIVTLATISGGTLATTHVLARPALHAHHGAAATMHPTRSITASATRTIRPSTARRPFTLPQRAPHRPHHNVVAAHHTAGQTERAQVTRTVSATRHYTPTASNEEQAALEFGPERTGTAHT